VRDSERVRLDGTRDLQIDFGSHNIHPIVYLCSAAMVVHSSVSRVHTYSYNKTAGKRQVYERRGIKANYCNKALFRSQNQKYKKFVNRLYNVLNVVEK